MVRVILRADDLGFSEGVNCGIQKAVRDGLIRTVGLMANMEAAGHGVELLKAQAICLGMHTVISAGRPVSDPKLLPSITQENGFFRSSREYRSSSRDFVNLDEAVTEIEAQYQRFIELTGHKPAYLDAHAVASANFSAAIQTVAERHGVLYVPFNFDRTPIALGDTTAYLTLESGKADYDPAETLKKMVLDAHDGAVEIMICHPGYLDAAILRNSTLTLNRVKETEMLCDPAIRQWLERSGAELITYDDIRNIR